MRAWVLAALALVSACGESAPAAATSAPPATPSTGSGAVPTPATPAPEPPPPAPSGRDGDLEWSLRASATTLTMDERAGWTITTVATNVGTETVDFFESGLSSYRVNGLSSIPLELGFGNGTAPASWGTLAPGDAATPERGGLGESLFPEPGDYDIVMTHGAAVVGLTIHVLPGTGAAPAAAPAAPTASARDGDLEWRLRASSTTVSLAHADDWELRTEATNVGTGPVDALAAGTGTFTLDGASSMALDMAFGNGGSPASYAALPPGETATSARLMGSIFETTGDHTISMTTSGGATVSLVVHVVP